MTHWEKWENTLFHEHITLFLLWNLSVCTSMHVWCLPVCLSVRYIARWVSIHSLCMHNQTGDSQTSTPLFSWDLLCLFFIFHILSWLIEETCNLSKLTFFFGVECNTYIYIFSVCINEIDPLVSMIVFKIELLTLCT